MSRRIGSVVLIRQIHCQRKETMDKLVEIFFRHEDVMAWVVFSLIGLGIFAGVTTLVP
jgi:hypothetical protein